jgi:hypothetical protein
VWHSVVLSVYLYTPRNAPLPSILSYNFAASVMPGFTARFSDPSACGRSLCGQMPGIDRSPLATAAFQHAMGHSHKRSHHASSSDTAPCRSRSFDTAFRSLTTTLAPPLRGQCSWPAPSTPHQTPSRIRSIPDSSAPFGFEAEPGRCQHPEPAIRADLQRSRPAPSIPHRKFPRTRSIRGSSAPFGFEAEPGRCQCPEPVFRVILRRSRLFPGLHSPSGSLSKTFRIQAFNRFPFGKPASPDVRLPRVTRCFLLRFRYRLLDRLPGLKLASSGSTIVPPKNSNTVPSSP